MPNESILVEVVSASVGGAFSASALYPLEVLKTKMQAKSNNDDNNDETHPSSEESSSAKTGESQRQESNEGDMEVINKPDNSSDSDDSKHATSESSKQQTTSAVGYAIDLYQKQGIAPFYAGIETSAFQSAAEKALYFFAYTAFKNVHTFFAGNGQMGTSMNLLLGCMAEWAHLPITLPIDCWTTQIQTGDNGNKGPLAILMTMLNEGDGIRGMYKGIQAYTILCLKPSIQYTVFEQVKRIMLTRKRLLSSRGGNSKGRDNSDSLTAMEAFFLGMFARTIATICTFPYLRAKVVLQSQKKSGTSAKNEKISIPSMIAKMYMSGGLGECFQGIGPELTRGVFSAALMMMMKEKISFAVRKSLQG